MESERSKPVLMIGLDAAEVTLVERWMEEGALPNLRALRDRGRMGRLESTADWFVGSPWQSFFTGLRPGDHGLYHYLVWRPDHMETERPTPDWLPLLPFWRSLGERGRRAIAIDVPSVYAPGEFDGIELSGWATHEMLEAAASNPPELMDWALKEFGRPPFGLEEAHLLRADELLQVRDQCVETTALTGKLAAALMEKEPWDLFLICFTGPHRGGHQLWDRSNMRGDATPEQARELDDSLRAIYTACDAEVGRLVEQAGPDVETLVFAVHGMGANLSRAELLREMLARILADADQGDGAAPPRRLMRRLRDRIPNRIRNRLKNRLPTAIQDWLTLFWRTGGIDWSKTRAFAAFCDVDGYVRLNVRGREAEGIVEPGEEYEALCDTIAEGLRSFVDDDTGEPVVDTVGRVDGIFPDAKMRHVLPDLIVRWSPRPAVEHRMIRSQRFGAIPWPTPGRHPQCRSGNHLSDGFVIAAGGEIEKGVAIEGGHILDLLPTVYRLLDLPVPEHLPGRPLL